MGDVGSILVLYLAQKATFLVSFLTLNTKFLMDNATGA